MPYLSSFLRRRLRGGSSLPLVYLIDDLLLQFKIGNGRGLFCLRRKQTEQFLAENAVLSADLVRTNKPALKKAFDGGGAHTQNLARLIGGLDAVFLDFLTHRVHYTKVSGSVNWCQSFSPTYTAYNPFSE